MVKNKSYFQEARGRAKRVKNPWNLLHIPFGIVGIGCCMWLFLKFVLLVAGLFGSGHPYLNSFSNANVRDFILIPLFFAALPLGLMVSNVIFWVIPPLRRIEDKESIGYKGTDFRNSMKGLYSFAVFSIPLGLAASILVAVFGK
jgi:hypothetical protein